jgi:hypothetical protein
MSVQITHDDVIGDVDHNQQNNSRITPPPALFAPRRPQSPVLRGVQLKTAVHFKPSVEIDPDSIILQFRPLNFWARHGRTKGPAAHHFCA